METNNKTVGLPFDILTIAGLYALLLVANYVVLQVVLTFYPVDIESYRVVTQIIKYARIIMPIFMTFLAVIHCGIFLLEEYLPSRMPEVGPEASEEEDSA